MLMFLARRLAATVPVAVIVAVIVFLMTRLAPGDPAGALVGNAGTSADIDMVRQQLGLDRSLPVQFLHWAGQMLSGDLGTSYFLKRPVTELVAQRIEPTLSLAAVTIVLSVLIALPLGVVAAWRKGSLIDRILMSFSVMGFSVPVFLIGYVLIWLFALQWGVLPVQGYARLGDGAPVLAWLRHLILPSVTLSVVYIALIARVTRAAMVEALGEDFIRTARAKGLSVPRVLLRHALASAAVPIVTVVGLGIALLIGGMVVTETVFAIPGLGQLSVDAAISRDYPVIQAVTLLFSAVYVIINLLIDISYLLLDPRVRY
ncbi:ABC transporter permease [Xanthobacter pseudotagetidis]|uniref:ABC transporter permease n=1 Tax=Xanthobacter pseudotagetidis TaxID=3119911 RepID=UPI00372C4336